MEHKGTVRLESERLILRQFTEADIEPAFRNWESDDRVTEFLRWSTAKSIEQVVEVTTEWIESYKNPDFYQWAIVPKDLGEPIGTISVVGKDELCNKLHIGYCIGSKWWHMGYTSEAFATIIPFLFEEVKAGRIESQHDPNNPNSGKVMEKCGLKYEGTLRKADWSNKGIVDACMYGITAEDYYKGRIKAVKDKQLTECVNVIRESFLTVANEFGFTVDNAPRFTAFATTIERLNWQLNNEHRPMYAYFDKGEIVGYYSLLLQDDNECELNNVCVLPKYRHKGIGEAILAHAFDTAKEAGCTKMNIGIVEENKVLRQWYEKFGFIHTGTKKFDFFPFTCGYMERIL